MKNKYLSIIIFSLLCYILIGCQDSTYDKIKADKKANSKIPKYAVDIITYEFKVNSHSNDLPESGPLNYKELFSNSNDYFITISKDQAAKLNLVKDISNVENIGTNDIHIENTIIAYDTDQLVNIIHSKKIKQNHIVIDSINKLNVTNKSGFRLSKSGETNIISESGVLTEQYANFESTIYLDNNEKSISFIIRLNEDNVSIFSTVTDQNDIKRIYVMKIVLLSNMIN